MVGEFWVCELRTDRAESLIWPLDTEMSYEIGMAPTGPFSRLFERA